MENERTVTGMAEYIERDLFLKNVKHNAPYIYYMVAPIALITPAADVAPVRHGRWCWEGRFRACSICGSYVEFTETLGASHWKYCPFCGAVMEAPNA